MSNLANVGITTITTSEIAHLSTIISQAYPSLITKFTYAASCGKSWLQTEPDAQNPKSSNYVNLPGYNTYFKACQPSGEEFDSFSPGVCPHNHILATITEHKESGGGRRQWEAYCCDE